MQASSEERDVYGTIPTRTDYFGRYFLSLWDSGDSADEAAYSCSVVRIFPLGIKPGSLA